MGFLKDLEDQGTAKEQADKARQAAKLAQLKGQVDLLQAEYRIVAEQVWRFFAARLPDNECRLYAHIESPDSVDKARQMLAALYRMNQFAITVDDVAVLVDIKLGRMVQGYEGLSLPQAIAGIFRDIEKDARWVRYTTPIVTARLVLEETYLSSFTGMTTFSDKEVGRNLYTETLSVDIVQWDVNTCGASSDELSDARKHLVDNHTDITPAT